MGDWVVRIVVLGVVAWVIWSLLRPHYVFEIYVEAGQPKVRKGKVTAAFLSHVATVCRESGVVRGWIGGAWHGRRVVLRFSRHIPPGPRQRLRNEWQAAG